MRERSLSTLIIFGRFSPSAKIMASKILLFPEPFGPEIDTSPGWKSTVVFLNPKDLKPNISTFVIWTNIRIFHLARIIEYEQV
jgi:hypothetical protein